VDALCTIAHNIEEHRVLKCEHIRVITAGEEAFFATALQQKFGPFLCRKLTVWQLKPQLIIRVDPLSTHYGRTLC